MDININNKNKGEKESLDDLVSPKNNGDKYVSKVTEYFNTKALSNSFLGLFSNPRAA